MSLISKVSVLLGIWLGIWHCILHQPKRAHRTLRNLPTTLRGFRFGQEWEPLSGVHLEHEKSIGSSNPLRSYFDAHKEGRGIWKWLHYFDIFHSHLSKFVGREVHILEVGIYSGGSLEMWKDYFGANCFVYGVDVESACKAYENDYTKVFIGDQADHQFWRKLKAQVPAIDILIDDGGHQTEQQIVTLEEMLPHIRSGGVYLCEDVHSAHNGFAAYALGLIDNLNCVQSGSKPGVTPTGFQTDIQSIHFYPYIILIEKADKPIEQLIAPKHGTEWQPW